MKLSFPALLVMLCISFVSGTNFTDSKQVTDGGYTQFVLNNFIQQQKGEIGVVSVSSDGTVASAKTQSASFTVDESTVFEVGSTTKTFTALAMEILIGQGKLTLNDTLRDHLPASVQLCDAVGSITLLELVSHTSGLDRMPNNAPSTPNPMKNYTIQDLYDYFSSLTSIGPKKYSYSNTAFGVLGLITTLVENKGWEQLTKDLILTPLGLTDTSVTLSASQQQRFAPPYAQGQPAVLTEFTDSMVGAGGLRSTAKDMLRYTEYFAGIAPPPTPMLARAMARTLRHVAPNSNVAGRGTVDESWESLYQKQVSVTGKDGATAGFNCYICFTQDDVATKRKATVILANTAAISAQTSTEMPGTAILAGQPPQHQPAYVPYSILQQYAGVYSLPSIDPHTGKPTSVTLTVQVGQFPNTLVVENTQAPTVTLVAFQQAAFFNPQMDMEAYFTDRETMVFYYAYSDHYATRTASEISSVSYTNDEDNDEESASSAEDWDLAREMIAKRHIFDRSFRV